ncbi:MAG: hypothetical protein QM783_20740 [Phycisphaerales bacterium]
MEQKILINAFDFFNDEADYEKFLANKGEIRQKLESNCLPWDFEFFWNWLKPKSSNEFLFYENNSNDIILGCFNSETQTVENIFCSKEFDTKSFIVSAAHLRSDGSVFVNGKQYKNRDMHQYLLHFDADGNLLSSFDLKGKSFLDNPFYCFSEKLQTVFIMDKSQNEILYYNLQTLQYQHLFSIESVDGISANDDFLIVSAKREFATASLNNLKEITIYPIQRDSRYTPFSISFDDNILTLIQPQVEGEYDINESWLDSYYGGIFQYRLVNGTFEGHAELLFGEKKFSQPNIAIIDRQRNRIVLYDSLRSRFITIIDSLETVTEINWGKVGKNCNSIIFDADGNLLVGKYDTLIKFDL